MSVVAFKKVKGPHGWLSNMSPHQIMWGGKEWRTSEALFQALRFSDNEIREHIRSQKSPMGAKLAAKSRVDQMTIEPMSSKDVINMQHCVNWKIEQHPDLRRMLLETSGMKIVEDCTSRSNRGSSMFWGAKLTEDGRWIGRNMLGTIWETLRSHLEAENLLMQTLQ